MADRQGMSDRYLGMLEGITLRRLTEECRQMESFVTGWLDDHPRSYTPHLLVVSKHSPEDLEEYAMHVLAVPFNEQEEKDVVLAGLGARIYERLQIPLFVVFSAEAWTIRRDPGVTHGQPRHAPDRKEVIILTALAWTGRCVLTMAPVERDSEERMTLGAFCTVQASSAGSPLLEKFFDGFRWAALRDARPS